MPYSAKDLFGDLSDLGGFSDDDNDAESFLGLNNKRKSSYSGKNFTSNKKIRKDTWKSKSSSVGVDDSKNERTVKELYAGIRITKPLVSSDELKTLMQGRKMIKLSSVKSHINKSSNDIDYDWVTMAVIVNKTTKVSKNGKDYSIWNLTDMQSEKITNFFLFGSVHDRHWKLPVGTVIGLLNASFMNNNYNNNNNNNDKYKNKNSQNSINITITLDDPDQLLQVGTSKDLGHCKAIKRNGDICGSLIIRAEDEFCLFHIKNAYRKFSSKRADIQSTFANQEPEQYHFANNFRPDASLSQNNITIPMFSLKKEQFFSKKENEVKNLQKIISNPISRAARNLAAFSKQQSQSSDPPNERRADNIQRSTIKQPIDSARDGLPKLAKGYGQGQMIDLKISAQDYHSTNDPIKQRAIEILKKKKQANQASKLISPPNKNKKLEQILKRVESNLSESNEEFKKEIAEADREKEKINAKIIDEALKRKSINDNVVDLIENQAQQQHFKVLEKRECYENRLAEIKELDVKVVTCKICKYTATSQSDLCKTKNHDVQFHQAKKRFFHCKKCHFRKFTYDSIFPTSDCPNCGQISFEKTSIINIKTETKLGKDLLVRGEEIKFINSRR